IRSRYRLAAARRSWRVPPRWLDARAVLILAVLNMLIFAPMGAHAGTWSLVFEDDFDGTTLDLTKWYQRYIYNNGTLDHFKDEVERYQDGDTYHAVSNGILSLVATLPTEGGGGYYGSGMIRSHQTFRYGYFEARIKMPPGRGLFPAFWLNSDYDA